MYLYLRIDHSLLKRSPWGPGGGNSGEPFVCERGGGELGKGGEILKSLQFGLVSVIEGARSTSSSSSTVMPYNADLRIAY